MKTNVCYQGDCLEVMKTLPENSVDSIVTDPPYHLASIVKRFGKEGSAPAKFGTDGAFKRASTGFMGKTWDGGDIAFNPEMWKECLRVLKPGGHLLSFSGTRTYHRMAVAIEDAGFEVRDMIEWVYSTGFPKSLNVGKQLEKKYGKQETKHSLRPMSETDISQTINNEKEQGEILLSELSEQSLSLSGKTTNNDWGEKSSVERWSDIQKTKGELQKCPLCEMSEEISGDGEERRIHNGTQISDGSTSKQIINENGSSSSHRPQSKQQQYYELDALCEQHFTQEIRRYKQIGTALKPAHEPICLARKPLAEKTVAENCLKWGTGGINIDESRVESNEDMSNIKAFGTMPGNKSDNKGFSRPWMNDKQIILDKQNEAINKMKSMGRFPANLIHDNSEEVRECFPEQKSGAKKANQEMYNHDDKEFVATLGASVNEYQASSGNASRFFKSILYYPKASKSERNKGMDDIYILKDNTPKEVITEIQNILAIN